MPEGRQRDELELGVSLGLGLAQLIGLGPTSPQAAAHYQRALTLSRALPERRRDLFLATWGIWFHTTVSGRTTETAALSDELVAIAQERNDVDLLVEAYHARGPTLMRRPDLVGMRDAAQEVIRLYDRERHRDHTYYFGGHDSRVCARSFLALSLWSLGFPEQAQSAAWAAIEDGRSLGHASSHAHGLNMGSLTFLMLGDVEACRAVAEELYPLAEHNKFPWPLAQARFLRGWLASRERDVDAGLEEMLEVCSAAGTPVIRPLLLALIAEQQLRLTRLDAASLTLDRAIGDIYQYPLYEAEVIRLRGEVLLAQSPGNAAQAETTLRQAIGLAAEQSCRPLELRAAVSLAKLLGDGGRGPEARGLLAPVYGKFTEGFDTPDLRTAKALLAALN
jgi:predicted ATPase